MSERPWDGCWDKTATARATDKARKASRRRDGVTGVTADGVTAEMQSRGYLSPKRSAAGLQLLSGHQGVCARCCALLPPSPPWHQLPLERGAAHEPDEPCLSPSNGDKDRPRGLAIGHNFRPPAPAIGQKMLLAQDRAQAQRPACDPTGQTRRNKISFLWRPCLCLELCLDGRERRGGGGTGQAVRGADLISCQDKNGRFSDPDEQRSQ